MSDLRPRRVLVVTDHLTPTDAFLAVIAGRAATEDLQVRLVVLNPARAEVHLLHPERHDRAAEAEEALQAMLPELQKAAGAPVIGSVSVRHDPMDAIEETILAEPVDEILLAVHEGRVATLLHQDLPHRLAGLHLPITRVSEPGTQPV
ncbi:MAG: hypothetical protein ABIO16_07625 [Nocardioides sp.]